MGEGYTLSNVHTKDDYRLFTLLFLNVKTTTNQIYNGLDNQENKACTKEKIIFPSSKPLRVLIECNKMNAIQKSNGWICR